MQEGAFCAGLAFSRLEESASRDMHEVAVLAILAEALDEVPASCNFLFPRWGSSCSLQDNLIVVGRFANGWRRAPAWSFSSNICFSFRRATWTTTVVTAGGTLLSTSMLIRTDVSIGAFSSTLSASALHGTRRLLRLGSHETFPFGRAQEVALGL